MSDDLLSREEVLGGLPRRRARTALFAIERAAARTASDRELGGHELTGAEREARELELLDAFAHDRTAGRPTARDLERSTHAWAPLVPTSPAVRAAIAHEIGAREPFRAHQVPRLRAALGLDDPAVAKAYRRAYHADLASIYAPRLGPRAALAWLGVGLTGRLDRLSPFWYGTALTTGVCLPLSFFSLPIAAATIGPLPALAVLFVLGVAMSLAMCAQAEAMARSGEFRFGAGYLGMIYSRFLGARVGGFATLVASTRTGLSLIAGYVGLPLTLAALTDIPAEIWLIALVAVLASWIIRGSSAASTDVAAVSGLVAAVLLVIVVVLCIPSMTSDNLLRAEIPIVEPGVSLDETLGPLVGVVLLVYMGNVYVVGVGRVALPRDPSGRGLIAGTLAGTLAITAFSGLWLVAVGGVVPGPTLAVQTGAGTAALGTFAGPLVTVLAAVLTILMFGLSTNRATVALGKLVLERLPAPCAPVVVLRRRSGRLVVRSRGWRSPGGVGIGYLGRDGARARFAVDIEGGGTTTRREIEAPAPPTRLELPDLVGAGVDGSGGVRLPGLTLDLLQVDDAHVELRLRTGARVALDDVPDPIGLDPAGLASLDDEDAALVARLLRAREGAATAEVAGWVGEPVERVRDRLVELGDRGFVRAAQGRRGEVWRTQLAVRRPRRLPDRVLAALDDSARAERPDGPDSAHPPPVRARPPWVRGLAAAGPALVLGFAAEVLIVLGEVSFAELINVSGILTDILVQGIVPMLLVLAARRTAELVPGWSIGRLGHPATVWTLIALFLALLVAFATVIWTDVGERIAAGAMALAIAGCLVAVVRGGVLRRRAVLELREDRRAGTGARWSAVVAGEPAHVDVELDVGDGGAVPEHGVAGEVEDAAALRGLAVSLPASDARAVELWAHRIGPDGADVGLGGEVQVTAGAAGDGDAPLADGRALVALEPGDPARVRVRLAAPD